MPEEISVDGVFETHDQTAGIGRFLARGRVRQSASLFQSEKWLTVVVSSPGSYSRHRPSAAAG
eukprot:scaffold579_cov546-Prasinococcus_capsulatus_cf.AAC.4